MWRPLLRGILLLVGVSVLGTIGYMVLEGWTLNEAAYMTAITLTTVGFMEVRPLSPEARVFTILLLVSGVTVFFYLIGAFGEFVVSGQLRNYVRSRRMSGEIDRVSLICQPPLLVDFHCQRRPPPAAGVAGRRFRMKVAICCAAGGSKLERTTTT